MFAGVWFFLRTFSLLMPRRRGGSGETFVSLSFEAGPLLGAKGSGVPADDFLEDAFLPSGWEKLPGDGRLDAFC